MVNKCCVPLCKSGYKENETKKKIHFSKFPKKETLKQEWLKRISRDDFPPTIYSRACSLHFTENDIRHDSKDPRSRTSKMKRTILNDDAIPTIFQIILLIKFPVQTCQELRLLI